MPKADFDSIREKVKAKDYKISEHAFKRLKSRQLKIPDLENAIVHGEIVDREPNAKPYPKCIFLGPDSMKGEDIHIVCSLTPKVVIVTVYFPDETVWSKSRHRR